MDSCCAPSLHSMDGGAALHFGSRRDFHRFAALSPRQMMHFPRAKLENEALLTLSLSQDKWMENEPGEGGK